MIGALLAPLRRAWVWIAAGAGIVLSILAYGRHNRGQGRDEAADEIRTDLLTKDKEASDAAKTAVDRVDRADPDERDRLRERWTRDPD